MTDSATDVTFSAEIALAGGPVFRPDAGPVDLALFVLPQASILEVAATLDPLRAANRHLGQTAFRWRIVSPDGGAVALTCGVDLPAQGPLAAAAGAAVLIVIAGFRQHEGAGPSQIAQLRRMAARFDLIVGIDAGPWVMARAGLLQGHRATVHWEDHEDFAAAFPAIDVLPDRYVIDRTRATAGGAAPAADLMLHLIRARHGPALARAVAASFIYDAARPGAESQMPARSPGLPDPRLAAALGRIEGRLDAPESVPALARAVGLSPRRLEGLFRTAFGTSPAAHGRDLRLQAARRMLADTRHDLTVIALRTGFSSASALSRAFRRRFGQAPGQLRRPPG
jgi:transcriptional regulator GlxA family with amidase domain